LASFLADECHDRFRQADTGKIIATKNYETHVAGATSAQASPDESNAWILVTPDSKVLNGKTVQHWSYLRTAFNHRSKIPAAQSHDRRKSLDCGWDQAGIRHGNLGRPARRRFDNPTREEP
jgi:hypothetical protein